MPEAANRLAGGEADAARGPRHDGRAATPDRGMMNHGLTSSTFRIGLEVGRGVPICQGLRMGMGGNLVTIRPA